MVTARGEAAVLATVITSEGSTPREAGAKMLIKQDGTIIGTVGGGEVEQRVREKALEVMNTTRPQILHLDLSGTGEESPLICGGKMDVFLEPITPRETLYVCGAGHISQSLVPMAKMLGFHVVVIDPRPDYNNSDRFPDADSRLVEEYAGAFAGLVVSETGYVVICTPEHLRDDQCLELALGTGARYIGMVSSRKKFSEIKEHLRRKGISEARLDTVHAPVGLEIQAESPAEIAVSIMAEIVKVRRSPQ